jgi:hypothetical protein
MRNHDYRPPEGTKLGKAKTTETMVMDDGTRMFKKLKVRYWVERHGAREDYYILYNDKAYQMPTLAFIRKFKIIIKSGVVQYGAAVAASNPEVAYDPHFDDAGNDPD